MGLQIARSRSSLCTLGPKVGTIYILEFLWEDRDRDWWSWRGAWHGQDWRGSDRQSQDWHSNASAAAFSIAQPAAEDVHGTVLTKGWLASPLLCRPILHNRGRPYYVGQLGQFLRGIACTASQCKYNRQPCNFTVTDLQSDHHTGHTCSFCRRDREQSRG